MAADFKFREHTRKPLSAQIEVADGAFGGDLYFDSLDVSEGGVFLRSELLLELGDVIWLKFVLPGTEVAMRSRGRVVRVQREGDAPGMGIKFLDLSEVEQAALAAWLEEA